MIDPACIALDTNILVYAVQIGAQASDAAKAAQARRLLARLASGNIVIPAQVLGELFNVLVRFDRMDRTHASAVIDRWSAGTRVQPTQASTLELATRLATEHRLAIWDAVILSAAAEARCEILLSEDMQDGFVWRGVEILNPFSDNRPQWLGELVYP